MPKKTVPAKRSSLWTNRILDAAYMLALLGATENQMAEIIGVSTPTIKDWKRRHPEFDKAIKDGTIGALAGAVDAFMQRVKGITYDEEIATYDRSSHQWVKTTKKTFIPPDPWACARFLELKGRNFNWSVTQNVNLTQTNTNININLSELSTEQLAVLEHISLKQLPQDAGSNDI